MSPAGLTGRSKVPALAISALAISALAFVALLTAVLLSPALARWDTAAAAWVHTRATPTGLRLFEAVTLLGSPVAWATAVIATIIVVLRREYRLAAAWLAAFGAGKLLQVALKAAIQRARPVYGTAFLHDHSSSFPSGHAMGSVLCYGMLTYTLTALWPPARRHRTLLWLVTALVVALVSVSRVYLGVHFPTDVVGGMLAGTAWLLLCITIVRA
jgi:membrane-associated phospholipid phosphatase